MYRLFKKDLNLFFVDKRSVILTFLLPIILISLFAFAFGGIGRDSGKAKPIDLLIADLDQSATSKSVIAALDTLDQLNIQQTDEAECKKQVRQGAYAAALIFPKGYGAAIQKGETLPLELVYDEAREMEVGILQPLLIQQLVVPGGQQSIQQNIGEYIERNFPSLDEGLKEKILADTEGDEAASDMFSPLKMTSMRAEMKEEKPNLGLIQAVAGTAILMLLFSVAGLGTSILEEKENGTIRRLLYSPLKGSAILYGKMLFAFFIAILQLTLMFLFAWLAFGLDLTTNVPALILMILATAFAVSGFGIFLAAVSKTRQQAQSLSTLIILIMSAMGGSMIPLFIMPAIMRKIAVFSVNYWGIQGFYDIFWRLLPLSEILPRIFILLMIGMVLTVLSIYLFRKNVLKLL